MQTGPRREPATRTLSLLGSTGSIGTQALELLRDRPDLYRVHALTAGRQWELLARQANAFRPAVVGIADPLAEKPLRERLDYDPVVLTGPDAASEPAALEADMVLNALVGFAGFLPTIGALRAGRRVALANKESLVSGGDLLQPYLRGSGGVPHADPQLIPVDSEHSAMLQCLVGEDPAAIRRILITASGGPFRTFSLEQMAAVTPADALKHPNWSMGAKITIDSATMMNKGLEIIEAKWLFSLPVSAIQPVIHPQSVIHSMVEFVDGSTKAQLGPPDMKVPILYSLTFPGRAEVPNPVVDWTRSQQLTFEPVDFERFPCLRLAVEAAEQGGTAPAVLNAANEVAVRRFLDGEIGYLDMPYVIERTLHHIQPPAALTVDSLVEVDREARSHAARIPVSRN